MASTIADTPVTATSAGGAISVSIDDTTVYQDLGLGPVIKKAVNLYNASGASKAYAHFWNSKNPVLGTTAQTDQILLNTSERLTMIEGFDITWSNGMSVAATSDKGTAAVTSPASAVAFKLGVKTE